MRRARTGLRVLFRFLLFNFIFFVFTSPFVAIYGPFPNVRNTVLEAAATSMHLGRYLAWFVGQSKINQLVDNSLGSGDVVEKLFNFQNTHDQSITLVNINGTRFKGYLLEVKDPTRVKVAVARNLGQAAGQTTSQIAREYGAVAAVNAGGFEDPGGTGTGRLPVGVIIHNGYFLSGGDLKGVQPLVGLTDKGQLVTGWFTIEEMKRMHVTEGISFYPPLIINGKKQITHGDGGWGIGPRTAIGQRRDGTILLLVIDGRQPQYSVGATLLDVQNILYQNGAYIAANLDGGSSTTMYYNGKVINRPADLLGERSVSTAFIVE